MSLRRSLLIALSLIVPSLSAHADGWLTWDGGGEIDLRMHEIEHLDAMGGQFHIEGACISACTMFLGLKNVCVAPRAVLAFHSASDDASDKKSDIGNAVLMEYYPPRVQQWVKDHQALASFDLTPMPAETAWALGVKRCDRVSEDAAR